MRSGLGRVRGWVPDHGCGPDDEDKNYVACDTDYESIYCPVLTNCNSAGGMYVQLWTAGWGDYQVLDADIMLGRAGRKCFQLSDADSPEVIWKEYLVGQRELMQHVRLQGKIKVAADQQRGYIGLTLFMGGYNITFNADSSVSNILKYIAELCDEYFLVEVNIN